MQNLVVIAGSGAYPRCVVQGAKKAGVKRVDVLAVKGSTERLTCKAADSVKWISLGEIASAIRHLGTCGYDGAILAGQVNPLSLFRARFDDEVKRWLSELPVKNAHSIFGKLIEKIELAGVPVMPASLFMDDYIPSVGILTARGMSAGEESDVAHAMDVVRDIGRHDIGQTVMVRSGMVLSVEAFEGTNAAIRRGGRLAGRGSIVFKAARIGHDMRFDIPVVGLKTLKVMKRSGATALAFHAGRLVLLDRERVLDFANRNGIAIVAVRSDLPPAPLRP